MKTLDPVFDKIIDAVMQKPFLSVQDLYQTIIDHHLDFVSLASFYKYIAQMVDKQILLKEHGKLSIHGLRLSQITQLVDLVSSQGNQYESSKTLDSIMNGQPLIIQSDSHDNLDFAWTDYLMQIVQCCPGENHYFYNSHTYHILGMRQREQDTFSHLAKLTPNLYFLVGHNTPLDLAGADILSSLGHQVHCLHEDLYGSNGHFLNIIGGFVIELFFPPMVTQYFELFFQNTKSLSDLDINTFSQGFKLKQNCRLTIMYDEKRARDLKNQIITYFK